MNLFFKKPTTPTNLVIVILAIAFFLRIINFSFPAFTSDEARVGYRAFTLSHFGEDELGRSLPLVFNSLTDYQLPLTSYITALGVFLFGKNDFGTRILFILIGVGVIFLNYKIGEIIHSQKKFALFSALVLSFSPVLIFLSKTPNDVILLVFLTALIFYFQLTNKNKFLIMAVMILSFLTSKFAWLTVPPFVVFNLWFYQQKLERKSKVLLTFLYLILTICLTGFFITIPQFDRSLIENNFSILSDTSITPAINRLRGQGIESEWPSFLEKIIFNKLQFVTVSILHWFSTFSPGIYFGQFDKSGLMGFTQMGALAKVLIFPFVFGVGYLLLKGKKEERRILVCCLILTFPVLFSYPKFNHTLLVLTMPFVAFIISYGLINIKKIFLILIAATVVLEVLVNIIYISPEEKNTNNIRPIFVKKITEDIYNLSKNNKIAVSDNVISDDIVPFVQWYHSINNPLDYSEITYPYKFRQSELRNIKIIGSETKIPICRYSDYKTIFLSKRDVDRFNEREVKITKTYQDNLGEDIVFILERGLCANEN